MLLLLSCSVERHYETLSFFFDGVPDPNRPEPEVEDQPRVDYASLTSAQNAAMLSYQVAAPEVTHHEPVKQRRCDECHVQDRSASTQAGWIGGLPQLVAPINELCQRCHEAPAGKYVHGPVAARRCDFCHEPHQSLYPHLLRFESTDDLCRTCHVGETFVSTELHQSFLGRACIDCHDPHAAELEYQLREGWQDLAPAGGKNGG